MDKNEKNNNNVKSELSALFEDVQDMLNNSILQEKEKTPEKQKPVVKNAGSNEFKAIFDDIKKDVKKTSDAPKQREKQAKQKEQKEREEQEEQEEREKQYEREEREEMPIQEENKEENNIDYQLLEALGGDLKGGYEPEISKKTPQSKPAAQSVPLKKFNVLFRASAKEFVSREQNEGIFREYQKLYIGELTRLAVCGLLFFILIYLDLAPVLNLALPEILMYPSVYNLISLQIFLFAAFTAKRSLIFGFKSVL
ncbi:MAG: hypothetical protein FWH24_05975, partial [Oscillospiraceae bacterium]|nr:hypothetical protein [Oscillospiraceae bacterium]